MVFLCFSGESVQFQSSPLSDAHTRTEAFKLQLKVFDENNDGKLSLSEMARLLPIKENALKSTVEGALLQGATHKVDCTEIERIFASYDKDNNGSIEADELAGFAKDLLSLMKPVTILTNSSSLDFSL